MKVCLNSFLARSPSRLENVAKLTSGTKKSYPHVLATLHSGRVSMLCFFWSFFFFLDSNFFSVFFRYLFAIYICFPCDLILSAFLIFLLHILKWFFSPLSFINSNIYIHSITIIIIAFLMLLFTFAMQILSMLSLSPSLR